MFDTESLALNAMIVRIVGTIFFALVLYLQVRIFFKYRKEPDSLNTLRLLMITLTVIPFAFNFLAIYNNYIRVTNGAQNEAINNALFFLGAVASTATAVVLWLIYRTRK